MKLNRLPALAAFAVAVMLIVGQFVSGAKAAPPVHFQASGITTRVNAVAAPSSKDANPASPAPVGGQPATRGGKSGAARPSAQSPMYITVQGRLTDASGNPITVATNVTFNLYFYLSGGTAWFTENATVTPDSNGLFTYQLGTNTPINSINDYNFNYPNFLGITVGSDAEMTPRFQMNASPYAMSIAPGALTEGAVSSYGVLEATNDDTSHTYAPGLQGQGTIGVSGQARSSLNGNSFGGDFSNTNNDPASKQYGAYAYAYNGEGLHGYSLGGSALQQSAGVVGESTDANGVGGVFTGTNGVSGFATNISGFGGVFNGTNGSASYANGGVGGYFYSTGSDSSGILALGGGAAGLPGSGIGLVVDGHNTAGTSYAIYSSSPSGDSNFTLDGQAHIHGSNVSAASYEMEVMYDGATPAQIGAVLVADGSISQADGTTVVGVVKANADNADLALGVLSKRLTVEKQGQAERTGIDSAASAIQPGDHAYVTVLGAVQMKVGKASVGTRLGFASDGSITAAAKGDDGIGKVISAPDANGMATVFVNFK